MSIIVSTQSGSFFQLNTLTDESKVTIHFGVDGNVHLMRAYGAYLNEQV